ncbi:MAG: KEOPS complex subunit Pcc1 [Thermoplasmatota archaeon]
MVKTDIRVLYEMEPGKSSSFIRSLRLESVSSPPGGELTVDEEDEMLFIEMKSSDLSTCRAMLNSYMGLLSAAEKALRI